MDVLLFLDGVLFSRLAYIFHDGRLPSRTFYSLAGIQTLLALAVFGFDIWSLLLVLLVWLSLIAPERWLPESYLNEGRLGGFLLLLFTTFFLHAHFSLAPWLSQSLAALLKLVNEWGVDIQSFRPSIWVLFGFLLVANEVNLLIRSLFHRFRLEPRLSTAQEGDNDAESLDEQEYNAGRIIGILERWLLYSVMVASQNISVVAVIMAAKGFARFRQLEERAFAEYVLIGTLASTLLTLMIAQMIGGPLTDGLAPIVSTQ